jgi:hypothetical protein
MAKRFTTKVKVMLAAAVLVGVVAAGGGVSWVYINVIKDDPPPKLSFDQRDKATASSSTVAP